MFINLVSYKFKMLMHALMYKLRGVWYEHAFFTLIEEAHTALEMVLLDPDPVSHIWRIKPVELREVSYGDYVYAYTNDENPEVGVIPTQVG